MEISAIYKGVFAAAAAAVLICSAAGCSFVSAAAEETVDEEAVAALEELEAADVGDAVEKVRAAESSRAQVIDESIAESSRALAEEIASSEAAQAESIAQESRAAHEAYLQEICAGTNLVPGMVRDITDADLPVIHRLFQKTMVIGDSRAEAAVIHGVLTEAEVAYKRGAFMTQIYDKTEEAAYMYPQKVLFYMGLNDTIIDQGNAQKFKEEYIDVIEHFRSISPNTVIYVHCVPPVTQASVERNAYTASCPEFNEAVYQMCMEKGYHYIDATTYLTENSYYNDGQHFTKEFYLYWVQEVANKMGLWEDLNP